jgi:hypothetical protein
MKRTVNFKAYKGKVLILNTWAVEGHAAETEADVYQTRLNRGDFSYVEVFGPSHAAGVMYKQSSR